MKLKKRLCAAVLACAVAVSALSIGFASWATTVSATGDISASGSWDVSLTDASLTVSSVGASVAKDYSGYALQANTLSASQLSNLCVQAAVPRANSSASKLGTQATGNYYVSAYLCLVDTTRIDMTSFGTISSNTRAQMYKDYVDSSDTDAPIIRLYENNTAPDGSTVSKMKGWYYYKNSSDYMGQTSVQSAILAGLVEQSDAAVKQLRPDTFQNYALVCFVTTSADTDGVDQSSVQFVIANMAGEDGAPVTCTDTTATFADVSFSLPGAWAEYSLTVTNNGTADANLGDAVIALTGENTDQLRLDAPDLTGNILKSGESCTITVVVEALDDGSNTLDASGTLTITLPYSQTVVEDAPSASHTH